MTNVLNTEIGKAVFSGKYDDMTISEFLKMFKETKQNRKIKYYEDEPDNIWTYLIKRERNPCGCGCQL